MSREGRASCRVRVRVRDRVRVKDRVGVRVRVRVGARVLVRARIRLEEVSTLPMPVWKGAAHESLRRRTSAWKVGGKVVNN